MPHLTRVVAFVSSVEALDTTHRSNCLVLPHVALVDVQAGGRDVNDKEADQVAEMEQESDSLQS